MTIYLDKDYKCHLEDDGTMTAADTDAFIGKCRQYVEGFRLIPEGATWIRDDGTMFSGEMMSPCRDHKILDDYQAVHDDLADEYKDELASLIEMIYEDDMSDLED